MISNIRNRVIDDCIKLFDVCTCENCDSCEDKAYNKSMCESDATITYKQVISMLEQFKDDKNED